MRIHSIAFVTLIFFLTNCQPVENTDTAYKLGDVELNVTGNQAGQDHFKEGLLLLHSFEYEDAREAFLKAQQADPNMPMAFWGEAMTYNHSLWGEQDYDEAIPIIEKMKAAQNKTTVTAIEEDFMKAVAILYQPKMSKAERDQAYAGYMGELHEKHPQNQEIAAFYALSFLGSVQEGRDEDLYGKGAVIAKGILAENPNHPGALHYLIHSYDDPDHAVQAIDAAFSYAEVAPDASHALHMPSHIYVALGMWDQVVASNERSYQASLNRMQRKNLDNDARGYHAFHWLEYGYLQQGRTEEARQMVEEMQQFTAEKPSKRARSHLVYLKGTYLVESNDWESPIASIPVEVSDLNVAVRSQYHFLEGMEAFKTGDKEQLEEVIHTIQNDYQREAILASDSNLKMCSGATRETANETNIKESKTMEYQLRGLLAWLENDKEITESWLKKSVDLEESLSYSYGPPFIKKPTPELYAAWLFEQDRYEEALTYFDQTLERAPKRRLALEGKRKVAEAMGNDELFKEMEQLLEEITVVKKS